MRLIRDGILVLLGVVLPYWVSNSIPQATIQRDAGAAAAGLLVMLAVVIGLENRRPILDAVARKRKKKFPNVRRSPVEPDSMPHGRPGIVMRGVKLINNATGLFIGRGVQPDIDMGDTLFEGNREAIHYEGDEPSVKPPEADEPKP